MNFRFIINTLAMAGNVAPSGDNTQPWHFYWDGTAFSINYDKARVHGHTFPAWAPATLLSMGGVIEHISQAAEALEIPIQLEILPKDSTLPDCYARILLQGTGRPSPGLEQHALYGRHTNRYRYSARPIPTGALRTLEDFSEIEAHAVSFEKCEEIAYVAKLVKLASEVRFQTQEIHEWLGASLRFSESDVKKADGLDVRTLDLPPGGRLFLKFISDWRRIRLLNKVGIYKILANIDAAPLKKAPGIVAIIGENSSTGAIDAGRLLSRAWIHLNSQGLAVHPYYVVSDQIFRLDESTVPQHLVSQIQELDRETREFFDLAEKEVLYMLLRVGYPTREAPRSQRLPLDKVFTDLTKPSQD